MKADEIMKEMLDGLYLGKVAKFLNISGISRLEFSPLTTTRKLHFARTRKPNEDPEGGNMTVEKFLIRRNRMKIKELLEENIIINPDFGNREDEITIQTRRFNSIVNSSFPPKDALREEYSVYEDGDKILLEKKKILALMAQFVYETHYMLPYMQLVRKKYNSNQKYQMGYMFSLLRTLKNQQMILYSNLKHYESLYLSRYTHVKVYEKIVRLDVDIKDVLRLMYRLDKAIKLKEKGKTTAFYPVNLYV